MAQFDANMWYQMTEARVGLGSALTGWGGDTTGFEAWNISDTAQHWQILAYPDKSNAYAFRSRAAGSGSALAACYEPEEVDPSHTQPRIQPLNPNDNSQKWTFGDWGNNTFFISNVANGSAFHLDVHPGNPVFMSSQTSSEPYDPGQHWEIQTIEAINDVGWSTTLSSMPTTSTLSTSSLVSSLASTTSDASFTGVPVASSAALAAASSSPSTPTPPPSSGLSAGAAAGIGVGVAVVVTTLLIATVLLFLRRRANRNEQRRGEHNAVNRGTIFTKKHWVPVHEVSGEQSRVELPNNEYHPAELPTSFYNKKEQT